MNLDRLSRITDLFLEGKEMDFGVDADSAPVVVWVNKLNSFEEEEARRDGSAARSMRMLYLNDENPEVQSAREELAALTRAELIEVISAQSFDEDYLLAIDDVESDADWKEKLSALRMSLLIDDADLSEDDPRRNQAATLNMDYLQVVGEKANARQAERQADCVIKDLSELQDLFIQNWRNKVGLSEFFAEQRVTQIFYSLRDCQAVKKEEGGYDHAACKHTRLLNERSQVRALPEQVLEQALTVLSEITVDKRTAGNLDVPMSSSASSEQQKQEEELTPSIPKVMRPGAQAI